MLSKAVSALALLSTAVSAANVFTIQVGDGGFVYTPPSVANASNGDIVSFVFSGSPGNHTVSQASFDAPCAQLQGGFDSDFVNIPSGFKGPNPTFNITIEDDTKPIWFYCKQTKPSSHCIQGMVGAINAPTTGDNTLDVFKQNAMALSSFPAQTPGGLQGIGASASSSPSPLESGASLPPGANITTASSSASGSNSGSPSSTSSTSSSTSPAASNTNGKNGARAVFVDSKLGLSILLFSSIFAM